MRMKATVITASGARKQLHIVAPSRSAADEIVDGAYPGARYVSIIVQRGAA